MFSIALPTGRLAKDMVPLLAGTPYELPADPGKTRKLILEVPERGLRYILVKPSDVGVYVARGVCDVGIIGKDVLAEEDCDAFELLDLKTGACTLCVAAPADYEEDTGRALRVATKYTRLTREFYQSIHRETEIIKLHGSIEVAPLLALSDVIVDLVQTGTTLRENNLEVIREILPSSARLIANKASYRFKQKEIRAITDVLREKTEQGL